MKIRPGLILFLLLVNACLVKAIDIESANYIDGIPFLNLDLFEIKNIEGPKQTYSQTESGQGITIEKAYSIAVSGIKTEAVLPKRELVIGNRVFYTDFLSINAADASDRSNVLWYSVVEGEDFRNAKLLYLEDKLFVGTNDYLYVVNTKDGSIVNNIIASVSVINEPAIKPALNLIFIPFKNQEGRGIVAYNYKNNTFTKVGLLNDSMRLKILGNYLYGISDEKKKLYVFDLELNGKIEYLFSNATNIGEIYRSHYDGPNFYGLKHLNKIWELFIGVDDEIYNFRSAE